MFHQHAIEPRALGGGRTELLLFDNGNARPNREGDPVEAGAYSRALRLVLDEGTRLAAVDWSYGAPRPSPTHFFSPAAGDADRLPDGSGVVYVKALGRAQLVDVTYDRTVRWRQTFTTEGELYRAEVFPSLYATGWQAATGW